MKIVFLDFDGVLNSKEWLRQNGDKIKETTSMLQRGVEEIDPKALARVKQIVDQTGAQVVISSSWRILHSMSELRSILRQAGWIDAPIIGPTPIIRDAGGKRGDEIHLWLNDHDDIENFICLDDDGDFYADQNLIQTNWESGIQDEHVAEAIRFLGVK